MAEPTVTLTAGRSRRTIKPNRKYLNDSVVLASTSKTSSRSSSPDSDASEDDYKQDDDDDEEIIPPKSAAGRKSAGSAAVVAKKPSPSTPGGPRPRGRPPKGITKTEPVKNLRKEVLKKMDLSMLNMGRARVVLTPINKDIKRKLDLDTSLIKDKTPVRGKQSEKQPEKQPEKQSEKQSEKQPEKQPEKPKPKILGRLPGPVRPEKQIPPKSSDDKEKSKQPLFRKKAPEPTPAKQQQVPVEPKKLINPAAVLKHNVEKSILDKRHKRPEMSTSSEEDDDDDVQIVGISREPAPVLGRKSLRKSPLIAKEISPIAKKIVKPGFVSRITPAVASKITPPVAKKTMTPPVTSKTTPPVGTLGAKRKADSSAEISGPRLRGRPSKASKMSISLDSDDDESTDDEPIRRSTRSSLNTDKGSAASSPQNSSTKAKDSSAPTKIPEKDSVTSKASLSKSISLPALDKTKLSGRPVGPRPIQTPASRILPKPMAQSTPKPTVATNLTEKKSKSEVNLADPKQTSAKDLKEKNTSDQATIRIVNIGDIIKNKSASTPDVRKPAMNRSSTKDIYASSTESSDSDYSDDSYEPMSEKPKTNNQLVATILERKRPVNLDHLRLDRSRKRGRPSGSSKQPVAPKPPTINLMQDEEVDFEDMLQTNIVTANKVQKIVNPSIVRGRGRPSNNLDENSSRPVMSMNKNPAATLSSNNNNVYKSNNNGRLGSTTTLNRSGSSSPQKGPPRILNSTMKLGDNRPFAKLIANSDNKHYSIDLTDPDNNVKLIASPGSSTGSPVKKSPINTVPRPIIPSTGLRNTSNAVNKPVGGAVQRSVSAITSSSGNTKMKKITCYETWYVINIPNAENKPERPSFNLSMIGLGNEASNIQLPSSEWSHKIILTKRKVLPAEGEEVFNGDVEDRAISEDEKRNYEPCNIMFRRRTATPGKFNLQYDRAVIFKNDTFFINVDGKNCQLVGAPCKLDGTQDIETLLAVVDFVNLKNSCVELSAA